MVWDIIEKILSIIRRICFLCMVTIILMNIYKVNVRLWVLISVSAYILSLIISYIFYYFLYKKYPDWKYPFISRLWRVDICNPIIEHSQTHYQVGTRLGGLWDYRNYEQSSFGEKVKTFFVRLVVYSIIAITISSTIYAIIIMNYT